MPFYASWGGRVFAQLSRIRMELIRRTGCHVVVRMVQGRLVATGYRPRHSEQCPRLTPDHRCCRRMLAHRHRNWNRQHSSHVLFSDESIVSLYNCNGHARVFRCVVERLVDCCIQETDGIRRNDDQSGRGWPWTHHRILDENSADGSSFWACLPKYVDGSDDDESVWGIGLDVLSDIQPLLNVLGSCGQQQGVQFAWSAPSWFWTTERKLFPLEMRTRTWPSFDVIVFNRCPRSPWVRLLLSRTQRRTF